LKEECFPELTQEHWKKLTDCFYQRTQFPNCIGAIDRKHVRIIKPKLSGSLFHNSKKYYSILLLAIADTDYKFVYIDVGSFGKDADSTIFERTEFFKKLENNELNIPTSQPFPGTENLNLPYIFVGDEAFSIFQHIMRLYSGKILSKEKIIFYYRLSRARRNIESTFGILSIKWKIFHTPINGSLDLAKLIIKTCCCLHNYVRTRDGFHIEDAMSVEFAHIEEIRTTRPTLQSTRIRNLFTNYFVSDVGSVPWQRKILPEILYGIL
jgi:hypothetical protein